MNQSGRSAATRTFVKGNVEEVTAISATDLDDLFHDDLLPRRTPRTCCLTPSKRNCSPETQRPSLLHEFLAPAVRGWFYELRPDHSASQETPASFNPPHRSAVSAPEPSVAAFQAVWLEAYGTGKAWSTGRSHQRSPCLCLRRDQILDLISGNGNERCF